MGGHGSGLHPFVVAVARPEAPRCSRSRRSSGAVGPTDGDRAGHAGGTAGLAQTRPRRDGVHRRARPFRHDPPVQGALPPSAGRVHLQLAVAGRLAPRDRGPEPCRSPCTVARARRSGSVDPTPMPTDARAGPEIVSSRARSRGSPSTRGPVFRAPEGRRRHGSTPHGAPGGVRLDPGAGQRDVLSSPSGSRTISGSRSSTHIFPRARFVVLVRDGRAVAESLSRVDWWETNHVWWYGGTPTQWRAEGGDPWEICARQLGRGDQGDRARTPSGSPEQVMTLRYEDVVAEPGTALESLAGFIGLADDADWRASVAARADPRPRTRVGGPGWIRTWWRGSPRSNGPSSRGSAMSTERARRSRSCSAAVAADRPWCTTSLARHPDVGFVSNIDDRLSSRSGCGDGGTVGSTAMVPPALTEKGRPRFAPSEGYRVLAKEVSPALVAPVRDLVGDDATPWLAAAVRALLRGARARRRALRSSSTSSPGGRGQGSSTA